MATDKGKIIHSDKVAAERDRLREFLTFEKVKEQQETLTVLEMLRRTRKSRGGVGAPLQVPAHLAGGPMIVTDADLKASKPFSESLTDAMDDSNAEGVVDGEDLE
jgi:hypothetical protein